MAARLKDRYTSEILPALIKEFNYTNPMAAPKIEKIILNMGVGREAQSNPKVFDQATMELMGSLGMLILLMLIAWQLILVATVIAHKAERLSDCFA